MENKYPGPPPKTLVRFIIGLSGMNIHQLEKFLGVPESTISNYLSAYNRAIPEKHWHLFYDPPKSLVEKTKEIISSLGINFEKTDDEQKEHVVDEVKEEKLEVKKIGVLADLLKN